MSSSPVSAPRNGLGLASLILGIVGFPVSLFCFLGVICSILAIVFGYIGGNRAERGEATNAGQAKLGLILGVIGIVFMIALIAILTLMNR